MTMYSNSPLVVVAALVAATLFFQTPTLSQDGVTRTALTRSDKTRPRTVTPAAAATGLVGVRRVYVTSSSDFVASDEIERKLAKRAEFRALGLQITRDAADADFVVEVRRTAFSHFHYAVVDARTHTTIRRGEVTSLFGTASGRITQRVLEAIGG
jgi:hypothetical protein